MQREKSPLQHSGDDKRESSRRQLIQLFCDEDTDTEVDKSFHEIEALPNVYESKNDWVRSRLAQELLESERKYVESLELLVQTFGSLIEARLKEICPALADLIRIIQVISGLNRRFLDELSARMLFWSEQTKIGDVFLAFAPFLRMYCSYATQHQEGTRILHDLRQKGYTLSKLVSGISSFEWRAGSLESFLILPVQRLPRYQLLFQQLSERTPPDHPDYQNLQNAFRQASSVAFQINEAVRNRENCFKILEIQSRFNGEITLVAPHRRLIRSGTLIKISRSNKQTREFFLFNDMLIYARNTTGILHALKLNRQILIDSSFEAYDAPSTASKFPFEIRSSVKSFMVLAPSHEDKIDWLLRIMEVVEDYRRKIQKNIVPNSADPAPIWQPNSQSSICSVCSNHFNVIFRRKHHCRKCGNLVCANCSRNRAVNSQAGSLDRICRVCVSHYREISSTASSYTPSNSGQTANAGANPDDDSSSISSLRESSGCFIGDPGLQALADEAIATVRRMSNARSYSTIPEEFRQRAQSVTGATSRLSKTSIYESIVVEAARSIRRISISRSSRKEASNVFNTDRVLYLRAIIPRTISHGAVLHFDIGDLVSVQELQSGDKCFGVNIRTSRKGFFSLTDMIELGHVEPGQYGCPGVANTAFDASVYQFNTNSSGRHSGQDSSTIEGSQNRTTVYKWGVSCAAIPRNLLTIYVGESVEVIDARSIEWWSGYNSSGKFGWFPAEYVTLACSNQASAVKSKQSCQMCSCSTFVINVFDSNRCARCQHLLVKHSSLLS